MHAATSLTHAIDYVFQNRGPDPKTASAAANAYRRDLTGRCFSFQVVEAFAIASKHCTLNRADIRGFSSDQQGSFFPAFADVMIADASFVDDAIGGICIHWTKNGWVNLTEALPGSLRRLGGRIIRSGDLR